jgi:hypothetical protein
LFCLSFYQPFTLIALFIGNVDGLRARDPALKGLGTEIYKDVSTDISEKVG